MRVNLAQEKKQGFIIDRTYLIMLIIFIVLIASMFIQYTILNNRIDNNEEKIKLVNEELKTLREKRNEYLSLKEEINKMESEIASREDKEQKLPSITKQNWNLTLLELGRIIPDKVMINSLNINDKNLSIKGYGENSQIISKFLDNLLESELLVNIKLNQLTNGEDVSYSITTDINAANTNTVNDMSGEEEN